jgi:hypothetical protein
VRVISPARVKVVVAAQAHPTIPTQPRVVFPAQAGTQ